MNRGIISIIGFAVILILGTVGACVLNSCCDEIENLIESSVFYAEQSDYETAARKADEAEERWDKSVKILRIYANHECLYEVKGKLGGLSKMANEEAAEEFLYSAEQAISALRFLKSDK